MEGSILLLLIVVNCSRKFVSQNGQNKLIGKSFSKICCTLSVHVELDRNEPIREKVDDRFKPENQTSLCLE